MRNYNSFKAYTFRKYIKKALRRIPLVTILIMLFLYVFNGWFYKPIRFPGIYGEQGSESFLFLRGRMLFDVSKLERGSLIGYVKRDEQCSGVVYFLGDLLKILSFGFYNPAHQKVAIKYIAGKPGETISIQNKQIYINNDYYNPSWHIVYDDNRIIPEEILPRDNMKEVFIPKGYYFVLSHRWDHLSDSRTHDLIRFEDVRFSLTLRKKND